MSLSRKDFLTTAEVARKLGLSVASVQKQVDSGELQAMRTHGGHRRIAVESFIDFMRKHGYITTEKGNAIGILHHCNDLDPNIQRVSVGTFIRLMSHPMELLDMNGTVGTLFIDARSSWLQSTPMSMLENLCQKHKSFFYNANTLASNNKLRSLPGATMIPQAITPSFIEGFCFAKQGDFNSQKPLSHKVSGVLASLFEQTPHHRGSVLPSN